MKKIISLLLILILFTGCSIQKIEDTSFDSIIKSILYQEIDLANSNFEGYKFYLPRGTKVYDKKDSNLEIKDQDNTYYLYVDMISYYYKTKVNHTIDNNIFYSNNLSYRNKEGYIDITKVNNKYFLEVMYNYAKIESYVNEENLYDSFMNICYILATINYNDTTIKYRLNDEEFKAIGEEFDIFKSKKDNDNFLQWIEKYDKYEEKNTTKDQDIIETDED